MQKKTVGHPGAQLAAAIRVHAADLDDAVFSAIRSVKAGSADDDVDLAGGQRKLIQLLIEMLAESVERGKPPSGESPALAAELAERAARLGVSDEIANERYMAGHTALRRAIRKLANDLDCPRAQRAALIEEVDDHQVEIFTWLVTTAAQARSRHRETHGSENKLVQLALRNEAAARQLIARYTQPLDQFRVEGYKLRDTAREYLSRDCNKRATGAALGVTRGTVANRLKLFEKALGCPITQCQEELLTALKLEELLAPDDSTAPSD